MPHNRAAKCRSDPVDGNPFAINDVTSRFFLYFLFRTAECIF
uniref:Uncharacterized protein n=1 Tax=Parascaris equorum TaxID=6256 RepID=A0A914RFR3_PAREQ